ncbi:MAG: uroporphyrinogen-III C-methyltransferase [Oligoflexia bacterium]|nr:uroporphyrinogen-III C-methyltransferase [Oligoflexia bacterium]MBF0365923.1 uroporphyrinogen-III C-methyltransferase [Oligoflexia bacterium]
MVSLTKIKKKTDVYLVGAGPGDPKLLTLKAYELMQAADMIAYDALIAEEMLTFLSEHFGKEKLIPIGYRGYQEHKIEHGMHPQVIALAKSGKMVVRLKSGDPFIFGRGLQECMDLLQHELTFEIVPGITAALGAAAYGKFPLTAIHAASSITIASAHKVNLDDFDTYVEELSQIKGTLVLYMGAKKLSLLFQKLIACGKSSETPAMLAHSVTTQEEHYVSGTLADLPSKLCACFVSDRPSLIIIGEVVKIREHFYEANS